MLTLTLSSTVLAEEILIKKGYSDVITINNNPVTIKEIDFKLFNSEGIEINADTLNPTKTYLLKFYFTTIGKIDITNTESNITIVGLEDKPIEGRPRKLFTLTEYNNIEIIPTLEKKNSQAEKEDLKIITKYVQTYTINKKYFKIVNEIIDYSENFELKEKFEFKNETRFPINNGNDTIVLYDFIPDIQINFIKNNEDIEENIKEKEDITNTDVFEEYIPKGSFIFDLSIPCAIDKTKYILPLNSINNPSADYKEICTSKAYFDKSTKTYHMKEDEGYNLDFKILGNIAADSKKEHDLKNISIKFYKEGHDEACFVKEIIENPNEKNIYITKIYKPKMYYLESMNGFYEFCGKDKPITFEIVMKTYSGNDIILINRGEIEKIVIDQIPKEVKKLTQEQIDKGFANSAPLFNSSLPNDPINEKALDEIKVKNNEFIFVTKNEIKKIISIKDALKLNNIKIEDVVDDIILENDSEKPEYVLQIKESKLFLKFIPVGCKTIEIRIPAIKDNNERNRFAIYLLSGALICT